MLSSLDHYAFSMEEFVPILYFRFSEKEVTVFYILSSWKDEPAARLILIISCKYEI